ncbi:MAG: DUF2281 domain-containing protein [Deltaproteobacteria bacterium]|nr:DUF2281 domain-containing protein [Deltaproteobacteria bacterium]
MTPTAQRIAELTSALPADKQAEVLDFVEFLRDRTVPEDPTGAEARTKRTLGTMAGRFVVPEDFNAPLPQELQRLFDGDDPDLTGVRG